jgi:hypothetical protein
MWERLQFDSGMDYRVLFFESFHFKFRHIIVQLRYQEDLLEQMVGRLLETFKSDLASVGGSSSTLGQVIL